MNFAIQLRGVYVEKLRMCIYRKEKESRICKKEMKAGRALLWAVLGRQRPAVIRLSQDTKTLSQNIEMR